MTAAASKSQEDGPIQATTQSGASVLPNDSTVVSPTDASSVPPVLTPPPARPSSAASPQASRVPLGSSAVLDNLSGASTSALSRIVPESSPPLSPEVSAPEQFSGGAQFGSPLAVAAGQRGRLNAEQAAAGTSVDAMADPLWGTYRATVNHRVDQQWQRLSVPQTRRAKIRFRIDCQGRLSDVQLLESSDSPLTDQAAIQAIQDAAPFAPLPQSAAEEILIVNFTFTYHGVEALP